MSFPMQLFSCRAALDLRSRDSSFINGVSVKATRSNKKQLKVLAMSSENSSLKMNLNEYMVTLQKPLGIRFGLSVDGKIFVHALKRGVMQLSVNLASIFLMNNQLFKFNFLYDKLFLQSNAEKSRIIMVGDTLKKASDSSGGRFIEIKNFGDAQ